ncbi:hypothetical protein HAX54_038864 [Datura stramonium]|uniref:Uncharacterized protein n=1 Tax=Datura stramonium TaxID=4076 RepID=A0ABS8SID6_DATST|nr:hypothetical protein [Datura stramonium]
MATPPRNTMEAQTGALNALGPWKRQVFSKTQSLCTPKKVRMKLGSSSEKALTLADATSEGRGKSNREVTLPWVPLLMGQFLVRDAHATSKLRERASLIGREGKQGGGLFEAS